MVSMIRWFFSNSAPSSLADSPTGVHKQLLPSSPWSTMHIILLRQEQIGLKISKRVQWRGPGTCCCTCRYSGTWGEDIIAKSQDLTVIFQLACSLHEWKDGYMKPRLFSAALYSRMYWKLNNLIKQLKTNNYHRHKFKASHKDWAQGGRYVFSLPLSFGSWLLPNSHQQRLEDDDFGDHDGYEVMLDLYGVGLWIVWS